MAHSDHLKTCIIIPCYNEEKRLDCQAFENYFLSHPNVFFLFVNDGSKDRTLTLLQAMTKKYSQVECLDLPQNGGKAQAVRAGVLEACKNDFDCIGYFDADLATPLEEIELLLQGFTSLRKFEVVLGSRLKRLGARIERKLSRHLLGRVFATFASLALELKVYDTQCGAKLFKKAVAQKIFALPFMSYWIFDVELLFRLKQTQEFQQNADCILEIPLNSWEDKVGSKLKPTDFLKAPWELIRMLFRYRRPGSQDHAHP
jgi:dolichyl-phosphate beta-glucosyltransferase